MQLLETIRNGWKVVDLRKKIFYTVLMIILFRIGSFIPAPFIDAAKLSSELSSTFSSTGFSVRRSTALMRATSAIMPNGLGI